MNVTNLMQDDLQWWIENLPKQHRNISHGTPDKVITSDASEVGWGAVCGTTKIGGRWSSDEINHHINYLELLAIFYALKSFCIGVKQKTHVQLMTDNTCAMTYVNKMGGIRSPLLDGLARKIWLWAINKDIWISAAHIPGIQNCADYDSRNFNDNVEWMLNVNVVKHIFEIWDSPVIDMFASRLNKQLDTFVSWKPDPEALFVDAFAIELEMTCISLHSLLSV